MCGLQPDRQSAGVPPSTPASAFPITQSLMHFSSASHADRPASSTPASSGVSQVLSSVQQFDVAHVLHAAVPRSTWSVQLPPSPPLLLLVPVSPEVPVSPP